MNRICLLIAITALLSATGTAEAQFGVNSEKALRSQFGYQPRTLFEPTLRTNFEPTLRTGFGFQTDKSATNTILSQRLKLLRARLPEEKKFVEETIAYVEEKKLSLAVVNDAFFYTIQRYPGPLVFSYFEQVLRIKATRLKQPVPEFDRSVYTRPNFVPQTRFNQ